MMLTLTAMSTATTVHIPQDWERIQDGIEAASDGDTIMVATGTYVENLDFIGKSIVVTGTAPKDSTIVAATVVDGDGAGSVVLFRSGEGPDSIIQGLTLINGRGYAWTADPDSRAGGGIFCHNGTAPQIRFCEIRDNTAETGGGIGCGWSTAPWITDCVIHDNVAVAGRWPWDWGLGGGFCEAIESGAGGALIERCVFRGNFAESRGGGGASGRGTLFRECIFDSNYAESSGGGFRVRQGGAPIFENCLFKDNHTGSGGGIMASNSSPIMRNCTFRNNRAQFVGGAVASYKYSDLSLDHCLLVDNEAGEGAGLHVSQDCTATLDYCTVTGHSGTLGPVLMAQDPIPFKVSHLPRQEV
jgi:hypothetical protein